MFSSVVLKQMPAGKTAPKQAAYRHVGYAGVMITLILSPDAACLPHILLPRSTPYEMPDAVDPVDPSSCLKPGDFFFIPSHVVRHEVIMPSAPACMCLQFALGPIPQDVAQNASVNEPVCTGSLGCIWTRPRGDTFPEQLRRIRSAVSEHGLHKFQVADYYRKYRMFLKHTCCPNLVSDED
jgi:hypothetical protein